MEFASVTERAVLVDPAGNRTEQVIEQRTDPLTGTVASINAALGEKAKGFLGAADVALLEELQEKTRAGCPFCAPAEKGTRWPAAFLPDGQLRIGDAVAMPNLFSKAGFDAVVVVDPARHVLFPSRLSVRALADAIRASRDLVLRARASDPALVHHVVGMNFLQPGGSSVPHPHFQVHVRTVPYSTLLRTMALADAFHALERRGFFDALLEAERERGARFVGRTGAVEWIAAFAPAHQKEVWGVLPGTASIAETSDADAEGFAEGIGRVVSFYEASGIHPFTFAFFSSPRTHDARFALHVKVCSRPAFRSLYANYDTWFTPKFMGDDVHVEAPEAWAERLRARW